MVFVIRKRVSICPRNGVKSSALFQYIATGPIVRCDWSNGHTLSPMCLCDEGSSCIESPQDLVHTVVRIRDGVKGWSFTKGVLVV
jgi:hypothetical protein